MAATSKAAKPHLMERTGWCGKEILDHTTPSARARVASNFLDRASTPPPAEEGSSLRQTSTDIHRLEPVPRLGLPQTSIAFGRMWA